MYRTKDLLDESSPKSFEFFLYLLISKYLNYANIAWVATYQTKLKTIYYPQKQTVRVVCNQEKLTHFRPLLQSLIALNACQINLCQYLNFMHNVSNNVAPLIFNMFKKPSFNILQICHKTTSV